MLLRGQDEVVREVAFALNDRRSLVLLLCP